MNAECAVCYVADNNFLLPSLVSAASVRQFVPPHKADIFIFTVGVDTIRAGEVDRVSATRGIHVLPIDSSAFGSVDQNRLSRTYTPLATLGRFFMEDLLPPAIQRIVYLDGDTWITQDPTALIEAIVPPGRFAAAEDTIFFRQTKGLGYTANNIRNYFSQLGLKPENGYFNAGVFAVSRDTWRGIAREAFSFFQKNIDICKRFDQSALNVVVGDRRLRLSSKWNFLTQLKIWGADRYVVPHILHFNLYPKPWMGACDPWTDMHPKYKAALVPFTSLNLPLKILGAEEIARINVANKRAYSYLQLPLVSKAALYYMNFRIAEQNAWM
jgi:lipopolysaccharide biosynthesis glycosyltransferase